MKFNLPIPLSRPDVIVAGPDGALWFTEAGSDTRIGRITVDGAISEILCRSLWAVHGIALGTG